MQPHSPRWRPTKRCSLSQCSSFMVSAFCFSRSSRYSCPRLAKSDSIGGGVGGEYSLKVQNGFIFKLTNKTATLVFVLNNRIQSFIVVKTRVQGLFLPCLYFYTSIRMGEKNALHAHHYTHECSRSFPERTYV